MASLCQKKKILTPSSLKATNDNWVTLYDFSGINGAYKYLSFDIIPTYIIINSLSLDPLVNEWKLDCCFFSAFIGTKKSG